MGPNVNTLQNNFRNLVFKTLGKISVTKVHPETKYPAPCDSEDRNESLKEMDENINDKWTVKPVVPSYPGWLNLVQWQRDYLSIRGSKV